MKTLIAGIGNIFMGDDAFGCEVVRRLEREALPVDVDLVDFGIRGLDLHYALTDGYEFVILIDTIQRGEAPGTVYVIEPDVDAPVDGEPEIAPHAMDPASVLQLVASLGEHRPRLLLVACEPACLGGEAGHMGLSDTVAEAVEEGVAEVSRLLAGRAAAAVGINPDLQRAR